MYPQSPYGAPNPYAPQEPNRPAAPAGPPGPYPQSGGSQPPALAPSGPYAPGPSYGPAPAMPASQPPSMTPQASAAPYAAPTAYPARPAAAPYAPPAGNGGGQPAGTGTVPPPPPRPATPYDFFMAPQKPNRVPLLPANLPGNKLFWIAGGGLGLVIVLLLAVALTPKSTLKAALLSVAQAQTETVRLCNDGVQNAQLQPNKSFSANCLLSMTTEQQQLTAYLTRSGNKPSTKTLALGRNPQADQQLKAAKSASDYDTAYQTVMQAQLTALQRSLKQAAADPSTTPTEEKLLNTYTDAANLLMQQLTQPST